jgi:hypothetical protein
VDVAIRGSVSFYREDYASSDAAYASELDVELGVDLPLEIVFRPLVEDWTIDPRGLCEAGEVVSAHAGSSVGLARRLAQIVGGNGSLCIGDEGASNAGDVFTFIPSYTGVAPPGQEEFLPGEIFVQLVLEGTLPDLVQENQVIPTSGSFSLTGATLRHQLFQTVGPSQGEQLTLADGDLYGVIETTR